MSSDARSSSTGPPSPPRGGPAVPAQQGPRSADAVPIASGATSPEVERAELERLRAEHAEALTKLEQLDQRSHRRGTARRVLVGAFVALFALLLPLTVTTAWAHRTVLNTDAYVRTVAPLASDPAVTAAMSRQITDQLWTALDPQARIEQALPPKAVFLAGPIANAAQDAVRQGVQKVLDSDQFQQLWEQANRFAHTQLVAVLRGDTRLLQTTDGQVVLNLVPILNEALKNAATLVSGIVGKTVTLPAISGNELPSVACEKIATALDRPVPATCGQVALFPAKNLQSAQKAVQWFDGAVVALLVITPLLAALALWLSRRRRRTLLQLAVGGALGLVVVRRVVMWEQNQLIQTGRPENKAARTAIVDGVLGRFFDLTVWFLVGLLVVVLLALVTGPYGWARSMRHGVASGARGVGHVVSAGARGTVTKAQDESTTVWVREHLDLLRVAGIVVAVALLLLVDVGFWGFVVIAALLAVYEVWLYRLRASTPQV